MSEYIEVQLDHQPIELCKLLKIADLVSGGGEAKMVIAEGYVYLNGEVEFQKRKKVYDGDLIAFNGDELILKVVEEFPEQVAAPIEIVPEEKITVESQVQPSSKKASDTLKKSKRRPISF